MKIMTRRSSVKEIQGGFEVVRGGIRWTALNIACEKGSRPNQRQSEATLTPRVADPIRNSIECQSSRPGTQSSPGSVRDSTRTEKRAAATFGGRFREFNVLSRSLFFPKLSSLSAFGFPRVDRFAHRGSAILPDLLTPKFASVLNHVHTGGLSNIFFTCKLSPASV